VIHLSTYQGISLGQKILHYTRHV